MKKVKFFSEPISDAVIKENLEGLEDFGITYDWGDSLITFYVEVDDHQGTKKIARAGDDLYYMDSENGYCVHYALTDNGGFARGIITELFGCQEWFLFCGVNDE